MCRFLAYIGQEVLAADLIIKPVHSLIYQSFSSLERFEPLNGDGFGMGWYVPSIDPIPCLYTTVSPAWADQNLHRLAAKVKTPCLFAHVRAASTGLTVTELNCHPFLYKRLLWMHNGTIDEFTKIKRRLREALRDDFYNAINGTTDSEHAFCLFLNQLAQRRETYTAEELGQAMLTTIKLIDQWTKEAGSKIPSHLNFAVTDGEQIVTTRYTNGNDLPESLYYTTGAKFEVNHHEARILPTSNHPQAVIIASEPLTDRENWTAVPHNNMLTVNKRYETQLTLIR